MQQAIAERRQKVLYDEKWIKFLRRTWPLRFIPFVDFALAAGSMATGNVSLKSDFDVLTGARTGRIFTARFFSVLIFGLLGWRRKKLSHKEDASDKICLNHFVTKAAYRLSGPHDAYWKNLYQSLVPIYGGHSYINDFFSANRDWIGDGRVFVDDLRHERAGAAKPRVLVEWLFSGKAGDVLEKFLRKIQIRRIEKGLKNDPPGYKPRIIYGDNELEFHPDTYRTQFYNQSLRDEG